jgi:hypothetical protein
MHAVSQPRESWAAGRDWRILALAIVSSNSAQTVVENEQWRDVFRYLEPEVEMVSRHTVHRDIMVLFNTKKTKVLRLVEGARVDFVFFLHTIHYRDLLVSSIGIQEFPASHLP